MRQFLEQQIEGQKGYIKDLMDDPDYTLENYLDVTKTDKMVSKTNNEDNYLYEKGRYTAFKEVLEELNSHDEFIIILDFSTGETFTSKYNSKIYDEFSDFLEVFNKKHNLELSESNCNWMVTRDELNIKHY